jgi:hypothetical protein
MPIQTGSGTGVAAVLTKETDQGCPGGNEATVLLGVDVDGDGALDATAVSPLPDCYVECQMFATPDVNGDGVSEVGVATTGADGYGITLYAVALSPPSIPSNSTVTRSASRGRMSPRTPRARGARRTRAPLPSSSGTSTSRALRRSLRFAHTRSTGRRHGCRVSIDTAPDSMTCCPTPAMRSVGRL